MIGHFRIRALTLFRWCVCLTALSLQFDTKAANREQQTRIGHSHVYSVVDKSDGHFGFDLNDAGSITSLRFGNDTLPMLEMPRNPLRLRSQSSESGYRIGQDIDFVQRVNLGDESLTPSAVKAAVNVDISYKTFSNYISVDGFMENNTETDFSVELSYSLPIDAVGWKWHDDLRKSRLIDDGSARCYENIASGADEKTSVYPLGSITGPNGTLTIALPLDKPRIARLRYCPTTGLEVVFDLGVAKSSDRAVRSTFSFIMYKSIPKWGMRQALSDYYSIFPRFFRKSPFIRKEGIWHVGMPQPKVMGVPDASFAADFGLGLNQIALGEVTYFKHGYYSSASRLEWDNALNVPAMNHSNFWYFKFPVGELPLPSRKALIEELKRVASLSPESFDTTDDSHKIQSEAAATFVSGVRDKFGALTYFPYKDMAAFIENNDLAGVKDSWFEVEVRFQIERAINSASRHAGHLSALFMDGVAGIRRGRISTGWNAYYDYDRDHWKYATLPLTFDHSDTQHRVAELTALSNYAGLRDFAAAAHQRGLFLAANMIADTKRPGGWFGADLVDYWCIEGTLEDRSTAADTNIDTEALWKRALAFKRPISLLQHFPDEYSANAFEYMLNQNLFYDIYPGGISSVNASWIRDPTIRALYTKYMPLFRELSVAGWEPVPHATISNEDVWLERFGSPGSKKTYIALRNEGDLLKEVKVDVDVNYLGKQVPVEAFDVLSGTVLPVSPRGGGSLSVALSMPGHTTRILSFRFAATKN